MFSDLLVHKTFGYLPLYPYHGKELCAKRSPLLYLSVVNGGWSDWSECSNGLQRRKCNKPTPASVGLLCVGAEQRSCPKLMSGGASKTGFDCKYFHPQGRLVVTIKEE